MSRLPASIRRSEMRPPDQPSFLADATGDEEATEDGDKKVIVDVDTTAETMAEIATMNKNTPALTAN
jgi:hypothetical protein